MRAHKKGYLLLGTPFALLFTLSLSACAGSKMSGSMPQLQIENLLLNEDDFPEGWIESPEGPHAPLGKAPLGGGPARIEATIVFFHIPVDGGSGGAFEEILRFCTERDAADAFVHTESKYFYDDREVSTIPPGLAHWRPTAATWRLGCTTSDIPRCHFVARYGEYLVGFSIDTSAYTSDLRLVEVTTIDQVLVLLKKIDRVMATVAEEH